MNPVADQGKCGSCWAFTAIAVIEGRYAIKYGKKVSLSQQQLIDCAILCNGCEGCTSMSIPFYFVKNTGGAMSNASYPYFGVERKEACIF